MGFSVLLCFSVKCRAASVNHPEIYFGYYVAFIVCDVDVVGGRPVEICALLSHVDVCATLRLTTCISFIHGRVRYSESRMNTSYRTLSIILRNKIFRISVLSVLVEEIYLR